MLYELSSANGVPRLLDRQAVASIGVGTEFSPFRAGISCYEMLLNYWEVQRNPDMTTMVHIDSTHKIVRQDYPVFVVGYSDKCSHFFPIAYFCTSKRQAFDVAWCLGTLKKAAQRTFGETFAPDFVMMDGDVAQFNACSVEIPSSEILMCWYHVTDNVFKQARSRGVEPQQTAQFFADLYDLHFAPRVLFEDVKARVLAKWALLAPRSAAYCMGQYVSSWINNPRFSKWQAFRTPSGCASTNNPLEQYHRTLKRICSNPASSPREMLERLDRARCAFLAEERTFKNQSEVPARLFKLYKQVLSKQCIFTAQMHSVGGVATATFSVRQIPMSLVTDGRRERLNSISSVNARRMHLEGIPRGGWIVDMNMAECGCLYFAKHAACLHVIAAASECGLHCLEWGQQTDGLFGTGSERVVSEVHADPSAKILAKLQWWRCSRVATPLTRVLLLRGRCQEEAHGSDNPHFERLSRLNKAASADVSRQYQVS